MATKRVVGRGSRLDFLHFTLSEKQKGLKLGDSIKAVRQDRHVGNHFAMANIKRDDISATHLHIAQ